MMRKFKRKKSEQNSHEKWAAMTFSQQQNKDVVLLKTEKSKVLSLPLAGGV